MTMYTMDGASNYIDITKLGRCYDNTLFVYRCASLLMMGLKMHTMHHCSWWLHGNWFSLCANYNETKNGNAGITGWESVMQVLELMATRKELMIYAKHDIFPMTDRRLFHAVIRLDKSNPSHHLSLLSRQCSRQPIKRAPCWLGHSTIRLTLSSFSLLLSLTDMMNDGSDSSRIHYIYKGQIRTPSVAEKWLKHTHPWIAREFSTRSFFTLSHLYILSFLYFLHIGMIAAKSIILLVVAALAMYHVALRNNNNNAASSCKNALSNSIMATAWNRCLQWRSSNDPDTGSDSVPKKKYGYFLHITDMHVSDTIGRTRRITGPV